MSQREERMPNMNNRNQKGQNGFQRCFAVIVEGRLIPDKPNSLKISISRGCYGLYCLL